MKRSEWHFFLVLLIAIIVLTLLMLWPFLSVLALAAVFGVILAPVQHWLKARLAGSNTLAALVLVLLLLIIIFGPLSLLSVKLASEARDFYLSLNQGGLAFLDQVSARFGEHLPWRPELNQAVSWLFNNFQAIFTGTANFILKFILWLIALFYFLRDGEFFKKALLRLSPLPDNYDQDIIRQLATTINAVTRGALLIALIQGILVGVGFALFGLPHPSVWGAVGALAALIPGFGTSLVLVPGIIYLAVGAHWGAALGLLIWGALAVGLIDNLLAPTLYSRGSRIHPLFMLFAVLGGLFLIGPAGFILGPVIIGLLVALVDIYQDRLKVSGL